VRECAQRIRPGFRVPLPQPTVRLRLTLLYASLFLGSGACLLAFTYLVVAHLIGSYGFTFSAYSQGTKIGVHLPQILRTLESQQADAEKRQLLVVSGIALAIMAAASAGLGWVMAGRVLRPLRTITTAAQHISARNLDQRLALNGPNDELKELGDTFDGLLGRLYRSFAAQRQFIANVSHELRTPLARQRVLSQVALADPDATADSLRTAHERVLASGAQQERLIEALLMLALSQRGLERREPFDLTAVTGEVLLARQPEAERLGLKVNAKLGSALALGSPGLAERLATNLVDNAIRHNMPGGWITVTTQASGGNAILTVANSGPVVPPEQVTRLFQPFRRLASGRADRKVDHGLGLGLSIVEAIAAAHDAALTARPQPGGGLTVQVRFPAPQLQHTNQQAQARGPAHRSAGIGRSRPG
jgi:signal transduction histidine kinase